ncbi:MAG: hypothetical protein ACHQT6_00915 [Candidatus Acidiferrales bacterium]
MSETELSTTQQFDETNAAGLAPDEAQSTTAGQGTTLPPEDPPVTAAAPAEPAEEGSKHPVSPRKLAANRANAKFSTGPKTPEGKANSKANAIKHGLTARYFPAVIQTGTAERQEFEAVRTDLINHCLPIGPIEELLVEKITIEYMRYRRLLEREQLLCDHNGGYYLEIVDKLTRYQTAINRQLFEAMKELERLQAKRKAEEKEVCESESSSN